MLTFASIFSGCGGLDLGFVQEGFRCIGAYDCDATALEVHAKNIHSHTVICDLAGGRLPSEPDAAPDVLLAGSPCQGFSTIGKRQLDDVRNHLLIAAGQIAAALRPRCVIAENVPGALYGPHRKFIDAFVEQLTTVGYQCEIFELSARDFRIAQLRRRVFIAATLSGRFEVPKGRGLQISLREVLADIRNATCGVPNHHPEILEAGSEDFLISQKIGAGQKLSDVRQGLRSVHTWEIPNVFGRTTLSERKLLEAVLRLRRRERCRETGDADPVSLRSLRQFVGSKVDDDVDCLLQKHFLRKIGSKVDLRHTFNGKFRRLHWDQPSFTVDTRFGDPRNFLHPDQHRGLSVREAARIQGFPDAFVFHGSAQQQFKFVGNAVPPPLSRALAANAKKVLI